MPPWQQQDDGTWTTGTYFGRVFLTPDEDGAWSARLESEAGAGATPRSALNALAELLDGRGLGEAAERLRALDLPTELCAGCSWQERNGIEPPGRPCAACEHSRRVEAASVAAVLRHAHRRLRVMTRDRVSTNQERRDAARDVHIAQLRLEAARLALVAPSPQQWTHTELGWALRGESNPTRDSWLWRGPWRGAQYLARALGLIELRRRRNLARKRRGLQERTGWIAGDDASRFFVHPSGVVVQPGDYLFESWRVWAPEDERQAIVVCASAQGALNLWARTRGCEALVAPTQEEVKSP
jgi:hypothetical protein